MGWEFSEDLVRRQGSGCSGSGERERKKVNFTQNIMPRGLYVDKVLCEILANSNSEEQFQPRTKTVSQTVKKRSCNEPASFSFFHLFIPSLGERR